VVAPLEFPKLPPTERKLCRLSLEKCGQRQLRKLLRQSAHLEYSHRKLEINNQYNYLNEKKSTSKFNENFVSSRRLMEAGGLVRPSLRMPSEVDLNFKADASTHISLDPGFAVGCLAQHLFPDGIHLTRGPTDLQGGSRDGAASSPSTRFGMPPKAPSVG